MLIDLDNSSKGNKNKKNSNTSNNKASLHEVDLTSTSPLVRMERPKSAKHNLDRLRKSAYLSKLNLINSRHFNNNSTNGTYSTTSTSSKQQDEWNIDSQQLGDDLDNDDYNNIMTITRRKEQRMLASKSAYIANISIAKQRPQSARHNLDKYRNDVQIEKQKKMELIQQIYQQQQQELNDIDIAESNHHIQQELQNIEAMLPDDDDDLDNLDGLLIREEDDSNSEPEADYIDSKSNEALTNQSNKIMKKDSTNNKNNKLKPKNTKLLSRRIIDTKENNANLTNTNNLPSQMRLYKENTFNHLNKLVPALTNNEQSNTNTTYIHTTNPLSQHSTNHNHNNEIQSILLQQSQQQQQQNKQSVSSMSNYTNNLTRPLSGSTNNTELKHDNGITTNNTTNTNNATGSLNMIESVVTNSSSSSTCSSTSSSITAPSKPQQIIHLNQLENNSTNSTSNTNNEKKTSKQNKNSLLSQELLNEWYKNDDDVDLHIEPSTQTMQDYDSTEYIEFDNTHLKSSNKQLQQRNVKSNLQKKSIILALSNTAAAAGRSSRFSDYSSCSNKTSLSNLNQSNNTNNTKAFRQNSYLSRERTNNSIDPWTRRNPTLVAQNVLIKHRAELEQIASRHTSNSRTSNHSSLLTTNSSSNTNKYLLPDTKYFKKNNF